MSTTRLLFLTGLSSLFFCPATASAQTKCSSLVSPIYISGSSALEPLLKVMGPILAAQTANPHSLVYLNDGSCSGVAKFIPQSGLNSVIGQNDTPNYYDASYTDTTLKAKAPTCVMTDAPVAGQPVDVGISDVFTEVCTKAARPATVSDILGPAQAMLFIAPTASTQQAISAEEAYLVFGFGKDSGVTPWNDPMYYFIRPNSSGTINLLGAAIKVPAANWLGVRNNPMTMMGNKSGDVFTEVSTTVAGTEEKTVGIVGADIYDTGRDKVKALAFRWFNQKRAYWPDSTPNTFDKKNLRDGHYAGFGYAHLIATIDATTKVVTNANAKYFIDLVSGAATLPNVDTVKALAQQAHLIPQCAMKVTRTADGGPLMSYTPDAPCGCYFDSLFTSPAGTTPTGCTACSPTTACATGTCRNGFCEAK